MISLILVYLISLQNQIQRIHPEGEKFIKIKPVLLWLLYGTASLVRLNYNGDGQRRRQKKISSWSQNKIMIVSSSVK